MHTILSLQNILNDLLKLVLAIHDFTVTPTSPDAVLKDLIRSSPKNSCRIGFELIADHFGITVSSNHDMDVIRADIHGMEFPPAKSSMFMTHGIDF